MGNEELIEKLKPFISDKPSGWHGKARERLVKYWQTKLRLTDWEIKTVPISDKQVSYPSDCLGEERFFVGVEILDKRATIFHSRELTEEDVVHELLHIKYPEKKEDEIEALTMEVIYGNKDNI